MWDVATLKQVGSLENFFLWYAVILDRSLESLDVLHELEVCAALLDFLHSTRHDFVDQFAQNYAVFEDFFVIAFWDGLANDGKDPVEDFLFLFLVAWLS